jgi:uncharacterized protein YndB with AHSA1/START domain
MNPVPNGRVTRLADRLTLHVDRTFEASIEDVWAAVTEPERLARWLGTWRGVPTQGHVLWRMGFEEGADERELETRERRPPHRLAVTTYLGEQAWYLDADLSESDGVTTLSFSHPEVDRDDLPSVDPGWEYYLGRLVAAETGGDPARVDFEGDYYPAMAEYYRARRDARA